EAHPDRTREVNVVPLRHLTDLCGRFKIKCVFFSTDFVFDGLHGPYREGDPVRPLNIYGKSKREAEQVLEQGGIQWAIIRTILVYGLPNAPERSNFVLWVKNSLEKGQDLYIVKDHYRMPTLAEDLVDACLQVVRKDRTG